MPGLADLPRRGFEFLDSSGFFSSLSFLISLSSSSSLFSKFRRRCSYCGLVLEPGPLAPSPGGRRGATGCRAAAGGSTRRGVAGVAGLAGVAGDRGERGLASGFDGWSPGERSGAVGGMEPRARRPGPRRCIVRRCISPSRRDAWRNCCSSARTSARAFSSSARSFSISAASFLAESSLPDSFCASLRTLLPSSGLRPVAHRHSELASSAFPL